mmetsp:Transcript_109191/g.352383  ORF Transcript_109191/g.352383 Transcript_109191/m.352383 type:complete len:228 (-) Transcript_109191:74-757(-)
MLPRHTRPRPQSPARASASTSLALRPCLGKSTGLRPAGLKPSTSNSASSRSSNTADLKLFGSSRIADSGVCQVSPARVGKPRGPTCGRVGARPPSPLQLATAHQSDPRQHTRATTIADVFAASIAIGCRGLAKGVEPTEPGGQHARQAEIEVLEAAGGGALLGPINAAAGAPWGPSITTALLHAPIHLGGCIGCSRRRRRRTGASADRTLHGRAQYFGQRCAGLGEQ